MTKSINISPLSNLALQMPVLASSAFLETQAVISSPPSQRNLLSLHPPPLAVYALAQATSMTLRISLLEHNPLLKRLHNDHTDYDFRPLPPQMPSLIITTLSPDTPQATSPSCGRVHDLDPHPPSQQLPHLQQPQHHNRHLIIHPLYKSHSHSFPLK